MILDAREGKKSSIMFYLKEKIYAPGGSKKQEENDNMP